MRAVLVALTVGLAACNSVLDLRVPPIVDRDNDYRRDVEDNCPGIANPDQSDFDMDGVGDACDECDDGGSEDADADGILDGCDGCIDNGEDADKDSIPDNCDPCIGNGEDADKDSIPDNCDACIESGVDKDNDGIDDACDGDVCVPNGLDADGDGIDDACDPCSNKYADVDGDGIDDGCDPCVKLGTDNDKDGIDDNCDPCPNGPNHDEDGDGWFDACDDCKAVSDPAQTTAGFFTDGDGVGDTCDQSTTNYDYEIFDAFDRQNPAWYVEGTNWLLDNDQMKYLGGSVNSFRYWGNVSYPFQVTTALTTDTGNLYVGGYAIEVIDAPTGVPPLPQPSAPRLECIVLFTLPSGPSPSSTSDANLYARVFDSDPNTPIAVDGPYKVSAAGMTLKMQLIEGKAGPALVCSDGINSAGVDATISGTWLAGIAVRGIPTSFSYYDIITR